MFVLNEKYFCDIKGTDITHKTNKVLYLYSVYLFLVFINGFISFPGILMSLFQYVFILIGFLQILFSRRFLVTSYFRWGGIFIMVMFFSLLYCPSVHNAITYSILPFAIQFSIYVVLRNLMRTKKDLMYIIYTYIFVGFGFSVLSILLYSGDLFSGRRFGFSFGRNPNDVMLQLIIPVCFSFWMMLKGKEVNYKYLIFITPCILVMLCTGSKKSLLIFLFPILYMLMKRGKYKIFTVIGIIALLLMGYYALFNVDFLYNSLGNRVEMLFNSASGLSTNVSDSDAVREIMRNKAFSMFLDSPFFGKGAEAFRTLAGYNTYSHNNYTELLSAYGIIGFLCYYSLPFILIFRSINYVFLKKEHASIYIFLIAVVTIYFLVDWGCITTCSRYNMFLFMIASYLFRLQNHAEVDIMEDAYV